MSTNTFGCLYDGLSIRMMLTFFYNTTIIMIPRMSFGVFKNEVYCAQYRNQQQHYGFLPCFRAFYALRIVGLLSWVAL